MEDIFWLVNGKLNGNTFTSRPSEQDIRLKTKCSLILLSYQRSLKYDYNINPHDITSMIDSQYRLTSRTFFDYITLQIASSFVQITVSGNPRLLVYMLFNKTYF